MHFPPQQICIPEPFHIHRQVQWRLVMGMYGYLLHTHSSSLLVNELFPTTTVLGEQAHFIPGHTRRLSLLIHSSSPCAHVLSGHGCLFLSTLPFNCLRQDKFRECVKEHAPCIFPLLHQAYSNKTPRYFGTYCIESTSGIQQGYSSGPSVFALTINEGVRSSTSLLIA